MCESHLTLLYFYVAYVDNMMEWDAVAKHLNGIHSPQFMLLYFGHLHLMVASLKTVKRGCF